MMPALHTPALLALMTPAPGQNAYAPIFMYGAIFAIFYFVLIRPQSQQRKKHEETIRALKRGDEVVTAGGVVGEVVAIKQLSADAASAEDRRAEHVNVEQRHRVRPTPPAAPTPRPRCE